MNTKTQRLKSIVAIGLAAASVLAAQSSRATLFDKADNANALNVAASWTNNTTVPGSGDTAQWDSVVSSANTTEILGGSMSWNGINILNPPTAITINTNTSGNVLTLGSGGINMLAASQAFNLNSSITLAAPQRWLVGNNQTLTTTGPLARNAGSAIFFSFDNSSAQAIVQTNTTGILVQGNNTLIGDGPIGFGTGAATPIAIYNDVDYAGIDANNHVVPASTLPGTLYATNTVNGSAPNIGNQSGIYNCVNTNSYGFRITTTTEVDGFLFNTPQPNAPGANVFTYNGAGAWNVLMKSGTTLDVNAVLLTTNLGTTPVLFTAGGFMRIADAVNELTVYQNNPNSSLIWQGPITQRSAGGVVAKLGPGLMEVQVGCSYSGGTLINNGTILVDGPGTLGAGPLTVNPGGNFEGQSGATNFAPVIVNNGATNSVLLAAQNGHFLNVTNLTFEPGTTWLQFIYSNSIVPSATTAALFVTNPATSLIASNNVNINVLCSALTVGQFPLIKYGLLVTNSAGAFPFNLVGIAPHVLGYLSNNVANSSIDLVITNVDQPIHWAVGNGAWDIATTANWIDNLGNSSDYLQSFGQGDNVVFNDSASGPSPVTAALNTTVTPGSVTVSNNAISYTISGSGNISGNAALTKTGSGTFVLGTANSFKGGLNVNGGILNFSSLGNLGSGGINFNGGTLQYNGNSDDISVRTVGFGANNGGTIDTAGQTVNYANPIGTGTAGGGLTKTGAGTLTLNGSNNIAGPVVVNQGTLALGAASYISNSSAIIVKSGAILDANTSGVNLILSSPVNQILAGVGTVDGVVSNGVNTTISPATNGVVGNITLNNGLAVNGGNLAMDISSASHDTITVNGNLTLSSGTLALNVSGVLPNGSYTLINYTGSLASGAGSSGNLTVIGFSQTHAVATLSDATAGQINLIVASSASDNLAWTGNNGATWDLAGSINWVLGSNPWAYTNGDTVRFDDTGSSPTVTLQDALLPAAVIVSNNAVSPYTWVDGTGTGAGKITGSGSLVKDGPGELIIATADTQTGPVTLKNGTLQVGNGGIGDIGLGVVTNNATLIFDQADGNTHTVPGVVSGSGTLTQQGSAPLVLAANNSFAGGILNSANLQVGTGATTGTLGAGPVTNNGSLYLDRANTYALSNNISGSGSLMQIGAGTVTLASGNTYLNNTYVSNGVVKATAANQVPNANTVAGSTGWLVLDGSPSYAGTFDLGGFSQTINSLSAVFGTFNGTVTNSGTTGTNLFTVLENAATTYNGSFEDGPGAKTAMVLLGNSELRMNGPFNFGAPVIVGGTATFGVGPGFTTTPGGITMSNGTTYFMHNNGSTTPTANDNITIVNGAGASINSGQLGNGYGGLVSGGITSTNYIIGPVSCGNITEQFSNLLGVIQIQPGGSLRFASTTTTGINGSDNATFDVEGSGVLQTRNNFNVHCGALQGNGNITEPQAGGTGIGNFVIGYNNNSTTFSGFIIGSNNIVKVGTGTLTLSGGLTNVVSSPDGGLTFITNQVPWAACLAYGGSTTVSNGILQFLAPANLTNTLGPITLSTSTAVLDASQMGYINTDGSTFTNVMTNGVFEIVSGQTLAGVGTIKATNVLMDASSTLNVGHPTGLLTISATQGITLAGAVNMNIDPTNALNSELSASSFTVVSGATLSITNLNTNYLGTVVYHMFNQAINTNNFAAITLPTVTSPVVLSNWLSLNGELVVVAPSLVNLNPTNLVVTVTNNGTAVNLSWPADHTGWQIQIQTNSLATGLFTNWVTLVGTELVNSTNLPINPSNGSVFYRMYHP
jgi:fibronectin-binding autotransporter adhesin